MQPGRQVPSAIPQQAPWAGSVFVERDACAGADPWLLMMAWWAGAAAGRSGDGAGFFVRAAPLSAASREP